MKKIVVLLIALCVGISNAVEINPSLIGNEQFLVGRVGVLGDPNKGLIGPYVSWNDETPERLWGTGVFGHYDISEEVKDTIGNLFSVKPSFWEVLEKLDAKAYVGVDVGVANFKDMQTSMREYFGWKLGPIIAEVGYTEVEGGKILGVNGPLDESGLSWFIGVGRSFKF